MWIEASVAAGVAGAAGSCYFASTFCAVRGVHDLLRPGAVFRGAGDAITLSFDDGPHPERTPRVLDLLAEAGAKATFFLVGERAVRHPELVARIAREGHEIGNHSWSHPWLPLCGSRRIRSELERCQDALAGLTGAAPRLARPPFGARDLRVYRILAELELTPVLWSLDSRDWRGVSADAVARRLARARAGELVLLHDGNPKAAGLIPALSRWLPEAPAPCRLLRGPEAQHA